VRSITIFDLGGALLDWNPRHLLRKLIDDLAETLRRDLRRLGFPIAAPARPT